VRSDDQHHDPHQRAAVLHLLADAAVAVLISALLVGFTGWLWHDAVTAHGVMDPEHLQQEIAAHTDSTPGTGDGTEEKQGAG
jgi:hypothetical protein